MLGHGGTEPPAGSHWQPTTFLRFEEALDTSMGTARIVTDAGKAYIKAMGNRQGPHPLACEWVATHLAVWFGLPTFEFAIISIDAAVDEIPFFGGGSAQTGPALVTRAASGHPWGGSEKELARLMNPGDVGRLVVFDTWVSNCDRHPPDLSTRTPNYDNVFFVDVPGESAGGSQLIAMDHSHCFTCGRELNQQLTNIDRVKDDRLYGLFPAFKPLVRHDDISSGIDRLRELQGEYVAEIVNTIPKEWQVDARARKALGEFIRRRAEFVFERGLEMIARQCWPDHLFDKRS